jgi:elongation factor 2
MGAEGSKLVVQAAAVAHRETVLGTTPQPGMLGKSTNKHNRFWFVASPLTPELTTQFEEMGALGAEADEKDRAAALVEKHGWESKHARKILAVGPTGLGCNVLVDATVGIQGVDSVAEHLVAAFDATCRAGPVCSERLRGVRIDLIDAKIHAEGAQRRAPQCVPAAKRGMDAAILAATPTILEPVQNISLLAPLRLVDDAYDELRLRRSTNLSHDQAEHEAGMVDAPCTLTGLIPLAEASGLAEILRGRLSGKATHLTLEFSHFGEVHGNIWDQETMAGAAVATIRQRKALLGSPLRAEAVADRL